MKKSHTLSAGFAAVLSLGLLLTEVAPGQGFNHSQLFFDSSGTDQGAYGGNEIITISGNVTFYGRRDPKPATGGEFDFVQPASDVYIVPHGLWKHGPAASLTLPLKDVSNAPNTILGLGGGGFFEEVIATTHPQGALPSGDYDVVFDEHQDGAFQTLYDFYAGEPGSPAILVRVPANAPSLPGTGIAAMKLGATRQYEAALHLQQGWLAIQSFHDSHSKMLEAAGKLVQGTLQPGDLAFNYHELMKEPVKIFYSAFILLRNQLMPAAKQADDFMAMPFSAASSAIANKMKRSVGLAADPPDPDFAHAVDLAAARHPVSSDLNPLARALATAGAATDEEQRLSGALLAALEKYQGAAEARDPRWALAHVRAAQKLATLLADQIEREAPALAALRAQVLSYPIDFDAVAAVLREQQAAVRATGWPTEVEEKLARLGASGTALEAARAGFLALDFSLSRSGVVAALDQAAAVQASAPAGYRQLATSLDATITTLQAEPSLDKGDPVISLGGPFTGAARTAVALAATASDPLDRELTITWDLDGDGDFDDATGASINATWPGAWSGHISVRVENAAGRRAHAWAHVAITDANQRPGFWNLLPLAAFTSVPVGESQTFTAQTSDPDGQPVTHYWYLDGELAQTGSTTFQFTPTAAQVGPHALLVVASDGLGESGRSSHSWLIAVENPAAVVSDLAVTLQAPDTPALTGAEFTWIATVENRGPSAATDVALTQQFPPGLTLVRASSSFGQSLVSGDGVTVQLGTLAAGAHATVWVQTTAAQPGAYQSAASVSSGSLDRAPADNQASARAHAIEPSPLSVDLALAATIAPATATLGGTQTLTFTVSNAGPDAASGVVLETQLPESVEFVSSSPAALSSDEGLVRIALPAVAANGNTQATVVARPTQAGSAPAYARVLGAEADPDYANNETSALIAASAVPPATSDLTLTATAPGGVVRVGQPATWRFTVTNAGPNAAAHVTVIDQLPGGAEFLSAAPPPVSVGAGRALFTFDSIPSGQSRAIDVTLRPSFAGEATHRVTATSDSHDPNGAALTSSVTVQAAPTASADLAIAFASATIPATLNTNLDVTLTVSNAGPNPAPSATATLTLPEGLTFVSSQASQGTITNANERVTVSLGALAANGRASATFTLRPTSARPLALAAAITSEAGDPAEANNHAAASLFVRDPLASVALIRNFDDPEIGLLQQYLSELGLAAQVFDDDTVTADQVTSHRLIIWDDLGYSGPGIGPLLIDLFQAVADSGRPLYFIGDDMTNVTQAFAEPHATRWTNLVHLKPAASNFGAGGMTIVRADHPVTNGPFGVVGDSTYGLDPDVTTATGLPGEIVLGRSRDGSDTLLAFRDPLTGRKSVTQNELPAIGVNVEGRAERKKLFQNAVTWLLSEDTAVDLAVTQSASPQAALGVPWRVRLAVTNHGSSPATGVIVRDVLPAGLTFATAETARGSVSHSGGVVTALFGALAPGESATVNLLLTPTATGAVEHVVSVAAAGIEATPGDNISRRSLTITEVQPALLRATYRFEDTLAACQDGAPPLAAIDPANADTFVTTTVQGASRRVYRWDGSSSAGQTAGLSLITAGLVPDDHYSVELLFRFLGGAGTTRRVLDASGRENTSGLSLDGAGKLRVGALEAGASVAAENAFHHVVLTCAPGGVVTTWLDGVKQQDYLAAPGLSLNPSGRLTFFAPTLSGAGSGDYADGEIALLRVYEGTLHDGQIAAQAAFPFGPSAPLDPNQDFSIASNPHGVWTYGYSTTRGTPFLVSTISFPETERDVLVWSGTPSGPHIYWNRIDSTQSWLTIRQPPDLVGMDPSTDGRNAVLRFTAPASGVYRLQGRFQGIDVNPNGTDVALLKNGSTAQTFFEDYVNGFEQRKPFDVTVSLARGETVDFSVGRGGNSNLYDSTGLDAVVTPLQLHDDCTLSADVQVAQTFAPSPAVAGETVTQSITVNNAGPAFAPDVTAVVTLPPALTLLGVQGATAGALENGKITVPLGALRPGERTTFAVLLRGPAGAHAVETRVSTSGFDDQPANNVAASTLTLAATLPDLVATVRAASATGAVGQDLAFDIVVGHTAASALTPAITVALPPGATLITAPAGATTAGRTLTLPTQAIASGQTRSARLVLRPVVTGSLSVAATATATTARGATGEATVNVSDALPPPPELRVAISADPATPVAGTRATWTFTVTNLSTTPAEGVVLRSSLPNALVVLSAQTSGGGPLTVTAGALVAPLGTVRQGSPVTVTVTGLLTAPESALLSAELASTATEPSLRHRWRFDEPAGALPTGTTLFDDLGGAHGAIRGTGATSAGAGVRLPGGSPASAAYIDLPNGLISRLTQGTLEGWVTINATTGNWVHLLSFGSSSPGGDQGEIFGPGNGNGGGEEGLDFVSLTASRGTDFNAQRLAIRNGDPSGPGEVLSDASVPTVVGEPIHFAITMDNTTPGTLRVRAYRNGALRHEVTGGFNLADLSDVNNWLGRGNWTGYDHLAGTFTEFRLHDRVLTAEEIETSRVLGPDTLPPSLRFTMPSARATAFLRQNVLPATANQSAARPVQLEIFPAPEQSTYRLEWNATPGRLYFFQQGDDLRRWSNVPHTLQATQPRETWLDPGPPLTSPAPAGLPERYYRLYEILPP